MFYLDKTDKIYALLDSGVKYYFFSRPRRFGKSLMLSTMKYLFLGKKELFKNLFIHDKWEFEQFPVLYLSFAGYSIEDFLDTSKFLEDLKEYINENLKVYFKDEEIDIGEIKKFKLGLIIEQISKLTSKPVVVLIDEYDKPVLEHLQNPSQAEMVRKFFRAFYSTVKDNSKHTKLFFITGLTKIMKMSIFSVLNNLVDISYTGQFLDLIGYTQEEVEKNFKKELKEIAQKYNIDYLQLLKKVKYEYNGFNFGDNNLLYNPWAVNNFIYKKEFGYFWADTGIPSGIKEFIDINVFDIEDLIRREKKNELSISEFDLQVQDLNELQYEVLFFNSGYTTIREKTPYKSYYLKFPNNEAEQVMLHYFLRLSLKKEFKTVDWEKTSFKITEGILLKDKILLKR